MDDNTKSALQWVALAGMALLAHHSYTFIFLPMP